MGHICLNRASLALGCVVGFAAVLPSSLAASEVEANAKPYTVECEGGECRVDRDTYVGWRTYHANCHQCHGQDALGSTFAPSLLVRLQEIDRERFMDSLENGYTGQVGVMPGWGNNPNVNRHFDALYAYLMARSDEVLGPGRPKRIR
ncbi:MAG: c-type cytochrome [Candidatus Competibacterales bacterium]